MAKYASFDSWREELISTIRRIRAEKASAESLAAEWRSKAEDFQSRMSALQEKLSIPIWAELDSGATVSVGTKVRYMLRVYECTAAHTKALTRLPTNNAYWQEVAD